MTIDLLMMKELPCVNEIQASKRRFISSTPGLIRRRAS
jgi:hypothetical protein